MNIAEHSKNWVFVYLKMGDYRNAWHYLKRWIKFSIRRNREYLLLNSFWLGLFVILIAVVRMGG